MKSKTNIRNAIIFVIFNITCGFCYYLITFYIKYLPGNIFVN